ncbi:MAG: selenide, water dikinase SelD, partial [Bacteroidales bacterium]|nr:selenide, water dikinase SelD [Bacteroidales bacterium]
EIGRIAEKHGITFHSDAAQSIGKIETDVKKMGVGLLSVAGHKFYAPKGIGALYIKRGNKINKIIHGADHEMNLRPGTENVAFITGLGKACEIAGRDAGENFQKLKDLRDYFFNTMRKNIPWIELIGHPDLRLPNTANISFPGIDAGILLAKTEGIAASAGAACHADKVDMSYVLEAMKIPPGKAMGCIRFSMGKYLTKDEINRAVSHIINTVHNLKNEKADIILEEIKLTQMTDGMGCSCKTNPVLLRNLLKKLSSAGGENVLVDSSTADDAAVYDIGNGQVVVQTVDFITPLVDDPYIFGGITAANSLSDIYAMGAKPLFALNIVGFPSNKLPGDYLYKMMQGAHDKASEAGIQILGGHTINDPEPKFGLTVTGVARKDRIVRNSTPKPGDKLILTKPLGIGLGLQGVKNKLFKDSAMTGFYDVLLELNKTAAEIMMEFQVHACTDITGFGLTGHLMEMILPGNLSAEIEFGQIPLLPETINIAIETPMSGAAKNNLNYVDKIMSWNGASEPVKSILVDPQTSGGLLIAAPLEIHSELLDKLNQNCRYPCSVIGTIIKEDFSKIIINY